MDKSTGAVTNIEDNGSGEPCDGLLNTNCAPVNGLAVEPWNTRCIAVAVGMVHFDSRGSVLEICDSKIRRLYFKSFGEKYKNGSGPTTAFFGLAARTDGLWATGIDGIYQIGSHGTAKIQALPKFNRIGGIAVSFTALDFVLVMTDINQRRSLSGSVPLLVPR